MENPASWGPLEHLIEECIRDHSIAQARGVVGASLPMYIANTLRAEGYINAEHQQPTVAEATNT
jgi:hypothetical protein